MKIAVIGAGNVATHLVDALDKAGVEVSQVWSNTYENALALAENIGATAIRDLSEVDENVDLCIVSVKDDAIGDIAARLSAVFKGIIVHTSGAVSLDVFEGKFSKYGVFYPLQTFSKPKSVNFETIPLCLETGDTETLKVLQALAKKLSNNVFSVDSEKRKILHLAAVFACNFTNHLYALADEILETNGLPFDIIKPLIMETADKIQHARPSEVQTGPAIRGDEKTIKKHEGMLLQHPLWLNIYQTLSESIKKT